MKVKFDYKGEIINVDKIFIIIDDVEYRISETRPAYKDDGNIKINKNALNSSSTIQITPCVSNDIIIK